MSNFLHKKRKFIIAAVALVMTFILVLIGAIGGSSWVGAVGAIVGLYSGAEAAEGFAHARFSTKEGSNEYRKY